MSWKGWTAGAVAALGLYFVGSQADGPASADEQAAREQRLDALQEADRAEAARSPAAAASERYAQEKDEQYADARQVLINLEGMGAACGIIKQIESPPDVAGAPTFIDLNYTSPNSKRSVILIWGEHWESVASTVGPLRPGDEACGTREPHLYRGVLTAYVEEPDDIAVAVDPDTLPAGNQPNVYDP